MLGPIRHDLLLCFGLWRPYYYAYIAAWRENRATFLGPAYFMLFPDHKLMDRPLMTQSATFFLWLRLSYPSFQEKLVKAIADIKQKLLKWSWDTAVEMVCGVSTHIGRNMSTCSTCGRCLSSPFLQFKIMGAVSKEMIGRRSFEHLLV